jgi:hypothetical protein
MVQVVIEAWNWMGGKVDWAGVPVICEMLGFDDPETLIRGLVQIQEHFRKEDDASQRHVR